MTDDDDRDVLLIASFDREVALTHELAEAKQLLSECKERHKDTKRHLGVARQAREAAEANAKDWHKTSIARSQSLRELREALVTIKSIVADGFLRGYEKLEVIESRCDISLCNDALAKADEGEG